MLQRRAPSLNLIYAAIEICYFCTGIALAWDAEESHPCTIPHFPISDTTPVVPSLYPTPVLLDLPINAEMRRRTESPEALLDWFGLDFNVTLSSSNALSEHRRTIPLATYLRELHERPTVTPDQPANETWYLFGETYSEEWKAFLEAYELPPCASCRPDRVALSFGVGNRGSGVQWHTHGPGFSETLQGQKHWVLSREKPPEYHKDQSSLQWMENVYPQHSESVWECTLAPGQAIYFPDRWWHATINLDPFTAFVSTFTMEHDEL